MVKSSAVKRLDLGLQILRRSVFVGFVILIHSNLHAANLVTNGDFSSGTTGFTSDYAYIATPTCFESQFSVVTRAVDVHGAWTTVYDHTSGDASGKYFVANGSNDTSKVVWQTSSPITVAAANTNYRFEIYISSVYKVDTGTGDYPPKLQLQLGDGTHWIDMGTAFVFADPSPAGVWHRFYVDGKFSAAGNYVLRLINHQAAASGNGIGLDDISFGIDASGNGPTYNLSSMNSLPLINSSAPAGDAAAVATDADEDKDTVAGIESQLNISNRFLRHSIYASLNRMEWLRRNRGEDNLTHMDVNLKSDDSELNKALDLLPIPKYLNSIVDKSLPAGWSIWTEGVVTTGEVEETDSASEKQITGKSVSLGLDKEISENFILGAVTRVGNDDVDIEDSGSSIDADLYSLSFYGSYMFDGSNYVEGVIGVSRLDIDHTRRHPTGTLSGSRGGEQLYGSVVYRREFKNEPFHISPYGRIDLGYTKLDNYTESGTNAALRYDAQTLGYTLISGGILADYKIQTNFGLLRPHGRIEYGVDINDSSDAKMSYVTAPGTTYTLGMDSESSHNWRAGVGLDMDTSFGVSMNAGYERHQQDNSAYFDSFYLSAAYLYKSSTSYHLKLNYGAESMLMGLGVKTHLNDVCSVSLEYDIKTEELNDWQSNDAIMIKADIKF